MAASEGVLPDGQYALDPELSTFSFRATAFLLLPVRGTLRARSGTVVAAAGKVQAEGSADAASIATGIKARDWHLRSAHYLHAAVHPEIRLVVPSVANGADSVVATLYARGRSVKVPLTLESVEVSPEGELHGRLTGSFDRTPLGMFPRFAGVSRRIALTFDVVAQA